VTRNWRSLLVFHCLDFDPLLLGRVRGPERDDVVLHPRLIVAEPGIVFHIRVVIQKRLPSVISVAQELALAEGLLVAEKLQKPLEGQGFIVG
jgi:hypothetical protein